MKQELKVVSIAQWLGAGTVHQRPGVRVPVETWIFTICYNNILQVKFFLYCISHMHGMRLSIVLRILIRIKIALV